MRALGWICVGLALVIAAGSFLYVASERAREERLLEEYQMIPHSDYYQIAARRHAALSYTPGFFIAAAVGALGVLILAIRPPRPRA